MPAKLAFLKNPVAIYIGLITLLLVVFQFLPPADYYTIPTSLSTLAQTLKTWLPEVKELPGSYVQTGTFETSNDFTASVRDDPQAMLTRIKEWGRLSGVVALYDQGDTCGKTGVRQITIDIIQHLTSARAQKHIEWSRVDDQQNYSQVGDINLGEYAYQFWSDTTTGNCTGSANERMAGIIFRRNTSMGMVIATAAKDTNTDDDLIKWVMEIAKLLDAHLAAKTQP